MYSKNLCSFRRIDAKTQEITCFYEKYTCEALLCSVGLAQISLFQSRHCMHAYQGSMHPRPVSELKWELGSQARILEFVGSQQTLPSSGGLRIKRERREERKVEKKRGEKKERGTEGKGKGKGKRETQRGHE